MIAFITARKRFMSNTGPLNTFPPRTYTLLRIIGASKAEMLRTVIWSFEESKKEKVKISRLNSLSLPQSTQYSSVNIRKNSARS